MRYLVFPIRLQADYMTNFPDYTSAVLGVMAIFGALNWLIYARKNYDGPRLRQSSEGEI